MSSDRNILSKPNPQANIVAQILDTIKKHPRILILALGALTSAGLYLTLRKKQPQIALLPKGSKLTDPYVINWASQHRIIRIDPCKVTIDV